jgi:hypothetical protein
MARNQFYTIKSLINRNTTKNTCPTFVVDSPPNRDELLRDRLQELEKQAEEIRERELLKSTKDIMERSRNGTNCKYSVPHDYEPTQCHHPLIRGFKTDCICVGMDFRYTFNYKPDTDAVKLCGDDRLLSEYRKSWLLLMCITLLISYTCYYLYFISTQSLLFSATNTPSFGVFFNVMYSLFGGFIPLMIGTHTLAEYHDRYFKNMTWEEKLNNI